MKKYFLFVLLFLIFIVSCKSESKMNNRNYGNIDYYVCGIYMEVEKQVKMEHYDDNPKLFFKFENEKEMGFLNNYSGSGTCAFNFKNGQRVVKNEDKFRCYTTFDVEPVNYDHSTMKVYPIYYKNGEYTYDTSVYEIVSLNKGTVYQYLAEFTNNKQEYVIQIQITVI